MGVTEFRKCQLFDLDSFVRMKYLILLLVVLSGCQIVPRYHQRGFQVSLRSHLAVRRPTANISAKAHKQVRHTDFQNMASPNDDQVNETSCSWGGDSNFTAFNVVGSQCLPESNLGNGSSLGRSRESFVKHFGTTANFNCVINRQPPKKHSIFRPKDRNDRLELGSILCYASGLLLVLISWALANEVVFAVGAVFLAAGLVVCLSLGFNNIKHTFPGYMSVFTILGTIYMLARFGFLDELLSALKI